MKNEIEAYIKKELDDAHKILDELKIARTDNSKGKLQILNVSSRIHELINREHQDLQHRKDVYVNTVIELINSLSQK